MKVTKRQLRRIIKEWRQNPAKIRLARRQKDRQRMIDQMTFKQLKSKAFDSALFIQGRLDTGQYEYADIWEAEIPRLADYIDAAKVKAAEEGVTYDDIPEVRHNGGILDLSRYSLGGLPAGIEESKVKISKRQLKRIIKEEKAALAENYSFAPTAEEEAKRINDQAGPGPYGLQLVTDQAFWEKQGIATGEELAFSILSQEYSDAYKALHGIRPSWAKFENVKEVQDALDDLDREAVAMSEDEAFWATIDAEWEKERQELASLQIPGLDLDYEKIPQRQGMSRRPKGSKSQRRMESKVVMTRGQLRKFLREATDIVNRDTGEVLAFGDGSRDVAPDKAVNDIMKRLGISPRPEDMRTSGADGFNIELSNDDWSKLEDETQGKQGRREDKRRSAQMAADRERLNVDNLMQRVRDWASDVGTEYIENVPGTDLQDIAFDLAYAARYEFEQDEWDELLWHFDDNEDELYGFVADSIG